MKIFKEKAGVFSPDEMWVCLHGGSAYIFPEEEGFAEFPVDAAYIRKHDPKPGGYYVVYQDGYKSWSPAEAFESGYTRI